MKHGIKKIDGTVIMPARYKSVKSAVEAAVKKGVSLQGADLRGARLWDADLRGAYLWDADLQGADLRCADLRCAELQGADLRCADLWDADLRGADLQGADLQGADLRCAELQGADLQGADLRGARLWDAAGNNNEIKNIFVGVYKIAYTKNAAWIGCKSFTYAELEKMTPAQAGKIDGEEAFSFWSKNKATILKLIADNPAD